MENELAIIAIKGGRFSEAENMYSEEIKLNPSCFTYFGLGICKINLLLDVGRKVDEVEYCFEKALRIIEEKDKANLEKDILHITSNVLIQLKSLYIKLEEEKVKQATSAIIGGVLTIGAALIGSSKKSNGFTQVASLMIAGDSTNVALGNLSNLGQIPEIQNYIIVTGNEIIIKIGRLLGNEKHALNQFLVENELENFNALQLKYSKKNEIKVNQYWYLNNSYLGLSILFWPLFVFGLFKRYEHNNNKKGFYKLVVIVFFVLLSLAILGNLGQKH